MGYLDRIELNNFKSYGGKTVVGPLRRFTAVIGPNGSGKSNLMDAISFVLGVKTSQLRGSQLRDLVYRNMDDPNDNASKRKASVKLIYKQELPSGEVRELEFMRLVTLRGTSEHRFQNRVVPLERYNSELSRIGVLVKARNFLVFQNEVEGIANKSQKELTQMVEEISGSAEYRDQYENLKVEMELAQQAVSVLWKNRKDITKDRKDIQEQKKEADRYQQVTEELASLKTEALLYELFHVDEDIGRAKEELRYIRDELYEREREFRKKDDGLKAEKKKIFDLDKKKAKIERQRRRLAEELDKNRPSEVKYEAELSSVIRRMKTDEAILRKSRDALDESSTALKSIETELKTCQDEIKDIEAQIITAETSSVSAESLNEYRNLKEAVSMRTAVLQQEFDNVKKSADSAGRERKTLEARKRDLTDRLESASREKASLTRRVEELTIQMQTTHSEMKDAEVELEKLRSEHEGLLATRERHDRIAHDCYSRLRELRVDVRESRGKTDFNNAIEDMLRLFEGAHGRLSDLCKPSHAKHRLAISMLLGKNMDAIVVDTHHTASECIRYLRDRRVGVCTFLPLETVRTRAIDESLRRLGGTACLAIDLLQFDEFVRKAVVYAIGDAIVCDTLAEARSLRYQRGLKVRACSLDGHVVNTTGFITGGSSSRDGERTRRWAEQEATGLRQRREAALREIEAINARISALPTQASASERIYNLKKKDSILNTDRGDASHRIRAYGSGISDMKEEMKHLQPQITYSSRSETDANRKVADLEVQLLGLENELFGDFAQRHGLESIQQFEEQFVQKSKALRDRKIELENREVTLKSALKNKKSSKKLEEVDGLEKKVRSLVVRKKTVEEKLESIKTHCTELESRVTGMGNELEEISRLKASAMETIADKRQEFRKETEGVNEKKKELAEKKARIGFFLSQRGKLLTTAKLSQIDIPVLADQPGDDGDESSVDNRDADGDVVMAGERSETPADDDPNSAVVDVRMLIDYSSLSRKLRAAATADKQEEILNSMGQKRKMLEQELTQISPNLQATENMTEVEARLDEMDKAGDEAREKARVATAAFESVKQKRIDLFQACFTSIASNINEVYKSMTMSANYPMGGTAYLSLQEQEEPFLGGIKFNAMPPTKRFRDMDQLSGGERSVAALALLFAIHEFRPSPFFVLDEVDAALDKINVSKVARFIRSRSPQVQTIVISLKDSFFEHADALIGICKGKGINSSRALSIELSQPDLQSH